MVHADESSLPVEATSPSRPRQFWLELTAQVVGGLLAAALGLFAAMLLARFFQVALPFLGLMGSVLGFLFGRRPIRMRMLGLGSDEKALDTLLVLQVLAVLVVVFVPFGFDHPSSWGLDFGHLLLVAGSYAIVWLLGLATALALRRWSLLLAELALPCAFVLLVYSGVLKV